MEDAIMQRTERQPRCTAWLEVEICSTCIVLGNPHIDVDPKTGRPRLVMRDENGTILCCWIREGELPRASQVSSGQERKTKKAVNL